jgi:CRISPR-associated protein Csm2
MAQPTREEGRKLLAPEAIRQIISSGSPEVLVSSAEDIGRALAFQVTSSQIRNVFGTARQIELRWDSDPSGAYRDAVLLRPKIGYLAKRERGRGMADLENVLIPALEEVSKGKGDEERHERYKRFVEFLEAIVAYHKKHGGN